MDPAPSCAPEVAADECAADLSAQTGLAYSCVTLESFPTQTKCYVEGCWAPAPMPIDPLPLPVEPGPDEPITILPAPADPDVDPPATDDGVTTLPVEVAPGEAEARARELAAICEPQPLPPCIEETMSACVPPDCAVSSDGAVSCPDPAPCTDTPAGDQSFARCLPPDCTTSDDGSVSCEGSGPSGPPECDLAASDCSVPGSSGGGSSGSSGSGVTEPGVVEPYAGE
jgi:hypothetical protein